MIRKAVVMMGALACLAASGCSSYSAAVPSTQGKAYVTSSGLFGQHMMMCDATSGKPVCKEVEEK